MWERILTLVLSFGFHVSNIMNMIVRRTQEVHKMLTFIVYTVGWTDTLG